MRKNNKGFTLIELLVVIAIIGLLSTLAVVALNSARQKSRDSKRVADVKQIQTALELYFADSTNGYPILNAALGTATAKSLCTPAAGTAAGFKTACASGDTTYMGLVPAAPTPSDTPCNDTNNAYTYYSAGGNSYSITFCLGGKVGDLTNGPRTANANGIQ
jgi:prepilin-type N-terminal cleavage/methylation domain-containing protein